MRKTFLFLFITFVYVVVLSHFPSLAFARAGGGESFGGGSFGSGGFSSGGFGSGGFFVLPFFFGGGSGGGTWIIFLILFFFVIPFIIRRFGPRYGLPTGNWDTQPQGTQDIPADLSPITADDPNFNKERFIDRVQTAFFAIQEGWTKKDLGQVRGYMTDAMYQRLNTQINDMKARGVTNKLDQIAIGSVTLVKAEREGAYQSITAAIWASMIDYKIDDASGKIIEGNEHSANQFTEYWTFTRSNSVKTKSTDALITKTCPNCGAPLDINEFGKCKYCGAYVISGDFDWVLSDISQKLV